MFENIIVEQNPHWSGQMYEQGVARSCFPRLVDYLTTGMIVSVIGVRRAGKSTLLKQAINYLMQEKGVPPTNILFMNLEHPYFSSYSKNIEYLEKMYEDYIKLTQPEGKIYILLDEIQFFPEWPVFVKAHYEQKKVKFILTGSNSSLLAPDLITLLSGRTLTLEVFPLSFDEIVHAYDVDISNQIKLVKNRLKLNRLVDQMLKFGGFPEIVVNFQPSVAYDILNAYAKTILYQDVAPRLQIRKSVELERLFVYLISNIGKPFSYTNLSKLFDLTDKAVKEYVGAFCDSYLLFELEMFDYSLKKQIRNPKKVYSIDTGQVNAVAFQFSENLGRLLENLVFLELRRAGLELYYYKTQNNLEVDFLAKRRTRKALVQVAWDLDNEETLKREQRALFQALHEMKLDYGIIITYDFEKEYEQDGKIIVALPAYKFFALSMDKKIEILKLD
jgi:predicted AAA+ superfamily ATPase